MLQPVRSRTQRAARDAPVFRLPRLETIDRQQEIRIAHHVVTDVDDARRSDKLPRGNGVARVVRQVLARDPVDRRVEVRAGVLAETQRVPVPRGPLSSYREITSIVTPGVGAKIGGKPITGVAGPSDCVRSTTFNAPRFSSSINCVSTRLMGPPASSQQWRRSPCASWRQSTA